MSATTHAPKQIDPSASLLAEALGQANSHGRAGEEKGIRCNVIAPGFMDTRRAATPAAGIPTGR